MKCYSSDEPARGFLGDECQSHCFKETWFFKLKLVSNDDWWKRFEFLRERKPRWDTTYLLFFLGRVLCSSLLFVYDLFSVCFQERLYVSFSCCSSLDIRLFTYVFFMFSFAFLSPYSVYFVVLSNFLARFSRFALRLLLLAFLRSLCLFHFRLFLLKILSSRTKITTISSRWQSFSSAGVIVLRVD